MLFDRNRPEHPGEVIFHNRDTGEVQVKKASELPASFLFRKGEDGNLIPVVKVTAYKQGERLCIYEYGPNDALLGWQMGTTGE